MQYQKVLYIYAIKQNYKGNMKLICINDKGKPTEIPANKWLKKEKEYTPTWVFIHLNQNSVQGVQLAEIDLDESCTPYVSFKLSRFAIRAKDLEEFIALMRDCGQFTTKDSEKLKELIKQSELELV